MTDTVDLAKPTARKPAAKKPPAVKAVKSKPFKSVNDIRMGMKVRDPATGLEGIAMHKAELISGSVQYAIIPQGDGTKVNEGHFVDDFMLEFVDEGVSTKTPAPDQNARFALGVELEDTITGLKGIAIERTTYLNGCVHYTLQPQQKKNTLLGKLLGEPTRATHFDYKRLKQTGPGEIVQPAPVAPKAEPVKEPEPFKHTRSPTGGPMRSVSAAGMR